MTNVIGIEEKSILNEKKYSLNKAERTSLCGFSLVNSVLLLSVVVFMLIIVNSLVHNKEAEKICNNLECVAVAGKMLSAMDHSVQPCENFYEFVCGLYMDGKVEKLQVLTDTNVIDSKMKERMLTTLIEDITHKESKTNQVVKTFFQSCMNYNKIQSIGTKSMEEIMKKFNGWPTVDEEELDENSEFDWKTMQYNLLKKGFSEPYLIGAEKDDDGMILISGPQPIISQDALRIGLDNKDVKNYLNYMVRMAVLFGANYSTAEQDMTDVIEFEKTIITNLDSIEGELDELSIEDFNEKFPFMEQYLNKWMKKTQVEQVKANVAQLNSIIDILENTSNRTLANYLMFRAVHEAALYLDANVRNIYRNAMELFEPPKHFLGGNNRWSWCIKETFKYFPTQANAIYARKYFPRDLKLKLLTITERMFDEVQENIKKSEYLDKYTKINALKKLNETERSMGINETWFDEAKTDRMSKKYNLTNDFLLNKLQAQRYFDRLDQSSDAYSFMEANSNSLQDRNQIEIYAGLIQSPMISLNLPEYFNYAGIGGTIGHEIMHNYDVKGIGYDRRGDLSDWWSKESRLKFYEGVKCITDQYGNFTFPGFNTKMNSTLTIAEDIADNSGFNIAYEAYKKIIEKGGEEPKLPGFEKYTNGQMFWIAFAKSFCSTEAPAMIEDAFDSDFTIDRYRVIGVVQNSRSFSEEFNCPTGSPMNPYQKCQLW